MADEVVVINEGEIPMEAAPWGRTKVLVGQGQAAASSLLMFKITEYMPGHAHDWHTHNQDEVIFILAGRGVTEVAGGKREIGPGDLIFIPAGVRHATYNPNEVPIRVVVVKAPPDEGPL